MVNFEQLDFSHRDGDPGDSSVSASRISVEEDEGKNQTAVIASFKPNTVTDTPLPPSLLLVSDRSDQNRYVSVV